MTDPQTATLASITTAAHNAGGSVTSYYIPDSSNAPVAVKVSIPPSAAIGLSIDWQGRIDVLSVT